MKSSSNFQRSLVMFCSIIFSIIGVSYAVVPVIPLKIIDTAPKIDGLLSDKAWDNVDWQDGFKDCFGHSQAMPAIKFKAATDKKKLFILIESENPNVSKFSHKKLERDKLSFLDETLEVFITPDVISPEYFHFAFDPAGNIYDNAANALATDNDYDIEYKIKVDKSKWILEIALPVQQFGISRITPGTMLDFNIGRVSKTGTHASVWSVTGGSFHMRNNFGRLVAGSLSAGAELQAKQLSILAAKNNLVSNPAIKKNLTQLNIKAQKIKNARDWQEFEEKYRLVSGEINVQIAGVANKLRVWRCFPWVLPSDDFIAPESDDVSQVDISGLKGEFLTLALCAANLSEYPVRLRIECSKIKGDGGQQFPDSDGVVRVSHIVDVVVQGGAVTRDALSDLNIETVVDFRPHQNEIIWLTIDTRKISAGKYSFNLNFCPTVKRDFARKLKVNLEIFEPAFIERNRQWIPLSHAYYYPQGNPVSGAGKSESYKHQVDNDLYDHYQNVYKTSSGAWTVSLDENGKPLGEPDFSHMDKLSARLKERFGSLEGVYFVTMPHPSRIPRLLNEVLGGQKFGSEVMKANLKWFLEKFNARLEYNGIKKENFIWYAADEPSYEIAKTVEPFYKQLVEFDPQQQICSTFYPRTKLSTIKVLLPIVNMWIPRSDSTAEQLMMIKSEGRKPQRRVMYNVCSRITPAYRGYLLRNYEALQGGYSGGFFWAYDDVGRKPESSMWDDFTSSRSHYACIYDGTDKPQSSVRWEAWRQGMQDWILYAWLKKLAEESPNTVLKKTALQFVEDVPKSIINNPKNYQIVDKYRKQARKLIEKLYRAKQ